MSVPYCGVIDGTTSGPRSVGYAAQSVNNSVLAVQSTGTIRCQWTAGATANTLSGYMPFVRGGTRISAADVEIFTQVAAPVGSGVGPLLVTRFTPSGDYSGYILRELTPGDPTKWVLGYYSDNSPETFKPISGVIQPNGVTDYTNLWVRYACIGSVHYVKIWKGAAGANEPAYFVRVADSQKTSAGDFGVGAWGADGTGDYAAFTNIKPCVWGALFVSHATQNGGADTTSAASYTFTDMFDAPANTPLWIAVVGSGDTPVPTISCANLVVDATVQSLTSTGSVKVMAVFLCHATADIIAGDLVVNFGVGASLTNCLANVAVLGGATTVANSDTATATAATTVASGLLTPSFSNPYLTSGTIFTLAKANVNAVTMEAQYAECGDYTDAGPATELLTAWDDANDTDITMSWTGSVQRMAIAAEVQLKNPAGEYPYSSQVVVPRARRNSRLLLARGGF